MKTFEARYTLGSLLDRYDSVMTNNGSVTMIGSPKGYAIKLNGSSQWISYAGTRNVKSVVVWFNAKALSKDIIDFDGGTHSIEVGVANITATGFVSPSIYIDTISSAALPLNKIVCLVITTAISFSSTALKIGKETSYFNGDILCVKLFDNTLDFNDIQKEQEEFNNARTLAKQKRGIVKQRINDLSMFKGTGAGQGLIFATNMQPKGNTLIDISGNNNSPILTGGNIVSTKDGVMFPNSGYYKKTGFTGLLTGLNANQYTVSMRVKFNEVVREQHLCDFIGTPVSQKFLKETNLLVLQGVSNALTSTQTILIKKWYTIHFLIKAPGAEIYINGISDASNSTYTENITTLDLWIGHYTSGGLYKLNGEIADIRIHNRILTPTEIKQYHNSFVLPSFTETFEDLPCDGSAVVPTGWIKGTGSYKGGEYVMKSGELVTEGNFSLGGVNWSFIGESTVNTGVGRVYSSTGANSLIQPSTSILTIGKRYQVKFDVIATDGSNIINTSKTISWGSTTIGKKVKEFTADETLLVFKRPNLGVPCDVTIDNVSCIEIPPLSFKKNQRYLECLSAGTISFPNNWVNGAVEFSWYKGSDANILEFNFINRTSNITGGAGGYKFQVYSDESIRLTKTGLAVLIQSTLPYIQNFIWYTTRIERTNAGQFTLLIKGGNFVPTAGRNGFTLVSTTGGSGSNPAVDATYNSSSYSVLSCGIGDRITNIRFYDGIPQL